MIFKMSLDVEQCHSFYISQQLALATSLRGLIYFFLKLQTAFFIKPKMIKTSSVQFILMIKTETKDTEGKIRQATGFRHTSTYLYF